MSGGIHCNDQTPAQGRKGVVKAADFSGLPGLKAAPDFVFGYAQTAAKFDITDTHLAHGLGRVVAVGDCADQVWQTGYETAIFGLFEVNRIGKARCRTGSDDGFFLNVLWVDAQSASMEPNRPLPTIYCCGPLT
jgi:hypothetical protein